MARITVSTPIVAPPEQVWDDIARLESHVEWMADAETIEFLGGATSGAGTRMRVVTRIGPFRTDDVMEFTRWEQPRLMEVAHRGLFTGSGRFSLTPENGGTRFTWSEEIRFPWYFGGPIGAWISRPILAAVWRRNLRRLAARFVTAR